MASDGSQPLGQSGVAPVSYALPATRRVATGVWDGPAPLGWKRPGVAAEEAPFDAAKEPRFTPLCGVAGPRLPLLLVEACDAAGVGHALSCGALLVAPGCEAAVGTALKAAAAAQPRATPLFIVATLPGAPQDAASVASAASSLLSSLGVSSVDVLLLDALPFRGTADAPLPPPLASCWSAALALVPAASRCVGLSHAGWRCVEALSAAPLPLPALVAAEMHPRFPQRKLCGLARRKGVGLLALSPLAPAADDAELVPLAAAAGVSPRALLLRYSVQRGVAAAPAGAEGGDDGVFGFRMNYPTKTRVDALAEAPKRYIAAAAGCAFADD